MDNPQASIDTVYVPTADRVKADCDIFDKDPYSDEALKVLFTQYPRNDNYSHVLLKVVCLNRLYSAGILNPYPVARHIRDHAPEIDSGLSRGSPEVVDIIVPVPITAKGKVLHFWAFATKYCSFHNPDAYPIWDSRVREYLTWLRQQKPQGSFLVKDPDSWTKYAEFVEIINNLRNLDTLRESKFSFKDIDKFLWSEGGKLIAQKKRLRAAKKDTPASTQL
jgi:hypothetical protein